MLEPSIVFPSVPFCSQRFRLLHHRFSINIDIIVLLHSNLMRVVLEKRVIVSCFMLCYNKYTEPERNTLIEEKIKYEYNWRKNQGVQTKE